MTNNPDPQDMVTVFWVLPPGVTLHEAIHNPGAEFTFPQTLTTGDTAPCGSVIQQDGYSGDPGAITADGILSWVNGQPEDHALYLWHTFYETPACVVVTPSPTPTPEIPVPPAPPTLAFTGANTGMLAGEVLVALGIIAVGVSFLWRGKRS